jgi:hypothetical protein
MRRTSPWPFLLGFACISQSTRDRVSVTFAPSFAFPAGIGARVQSLEVEVVQDSVTCDASTGEVSGLGDNVRILAKTSLSRTKCGQGVRGFCGALDLELSRVPSVFIARGVDADGAPFVRGCATAIVDKPAATLAVTLVRVLPLAVCGNGVLDVGEQCESANEGPCDSACHTQETAISQHGASERAAGPSPAFRWRAAGDQDGRFLATFTERIAGTSRTGIALRVLDDKLSALRTLSAVGTPPWLSAPFFLPNDPSLAPTTAPEAPATTQARAVIAEVEKRFFAAYEEASPLAGKHIRVRSFDQNFRALAKDPIAVTEAPGDQASPALATSSNNVLYVVWEASERIWGRTLTPPETLGPVQELSSSGSNRAPQIAAVGATWVVVWESSGDIRLRNIGPSGTPSGGESVVNTFTSGIQEGPRVAATADGRHLVTWNDRRAPGDSNVYMQRFSSDGIPRAGDQEQTVHDRTSDGAQSEAATAAFPSAGGAFAVAWLDQPSGQVRARYVGGDRGFLLNPEDGTESDFQVSQTPGLARSELVVAAGGALPALAFGWTAAPGAMPGKPEVYVRRFPLPVR